MSFTCIEGNLVAPPKARFAIVASRFNHAIVDRLVEGACDALRRHGVKENAMTLVRVPGAYELPVVCQRLGASAKFSAVVALGAVIRGETPHYDAVASEVSKGCAQASLSTGVPVAFGVLTTDTLDQAINRAGAKSGNKGWDAGVTAIEMVAHDQALTHNKL